MYMPGKGFPVQISTVIYIAFSVIIFLISLAFFVSVRSDFMRELEIAKHELAGATEEATSILEYRSLTQFEYSEKFSNALIPIALGEHPSPFSRRGLDRYRRSYPVRTFFSKDDLSRKADFLLGYSNILLNSGKRGEEYLSLIIWFEDMLLLTVDDKSLSPDKADHLWLVYHDVSGKTQALLISYQKESLFSKIKTTEQRTAEVAGFVSHVVGSTERLIFDNSIKGSVYYDGDRGEYALTFRLLVRESKYSTRLAIDKSKPIGIMLVDRNSLIGDAESLISTFQSSGSSVTHTLYEPKNVIRKKLMGINSNIYRVSLLNDSGDSENRLVLFARDQMTKVILDTFLKRHLFGFFSYLAKDKFKIINSDADNDFSIYQDVPINIYSEANDKALLRVELKPTKAINLFMNRAVFYLKWYCFVVIVLFCVLLLNILFIVKRVSRLKSSVSEILDNRVLKFRDPSLASKDEIGALARYLHSLLFRLQYRKGVLERKNHELIESKSIVEKRFKSREDMLNILGHDVRTPVTALLAICNSEDGSLKYVRQIQRAFSTISDVASIEEINNDGSQIKIIDLNEFSEAITEFTKKIIDSTTNIAFFACIDKVFVKANEEILEDALTAILNNAIDFGRSLQISVSCCTKNGMIDIYNDGEPISEDNLDTIFQYGTSYRSENLNEHFGMGLFSAYQRIRALGGEISIINREKGVSFIVSLPLV